MHANAKLTPAGRLLLVQRIAAGRPIAHVAREMGVARQTASRWWHRWLAEGAEALYDRSSRPHRSPRRTARSLEHRIKRARCRLKLGPVRIADRLGLAPSTVYRVLHRLGLHRLAWLDRPTGRTIRRYEHLHPGDLMHVDVKKLGRIPAGGGWKVHGRGQAGRRPRVATPTSTPQSTTIPASPTARSSATSRRRPPSASGVVRRPGSPSRAWRCRRCSPTPDPPTAAPPSPGSAPRPASGTASPGRTGRRPTARSSASTARCSRSGPTSGSTAQGGPALRPSPAGSISTITAAATPPSVGFPPVSRVTNLPAQYS